MAAGQLRGSGPPALLQLSRLLTETALCPLAAASLQPALLRAALGRSFRWLAQGAQLAAAGVLSHLAARISHHHSPRPSASHADRPIHHASQGIPVNLELGRNPRSEVLISISLGYSARSMVDSHQKK